MPPSLEHVVKAKVRARIQVPTAKEVAEDRVALEKRTLFKSSQNEDENSVSVRSADSDPKEDVTRKRLRPDSRRFEETEGSRPRRSRRPENGYLEAPDVKANGEDEELAAWQSGSKHRISLIAAQAQAKTGLVINRKQVGNPVLRCFRDVVYQFSDKILPDFLLGQHVCALFLSLRYHLLYPEYIYERIRQIGSLFKTRVLLCLIDIPDHEVPIRELSKLSIVYKWTLVAVGSSKEAARYLETFRIFENKSAESIMQRVDEDYFSKLQGALSSVRMVNKTDVRSLSLNFGSLKNIVDAPREALLKCPGIGQQKAVSLYDVFNTPFKRGYGSAERSKPADAGNEGKL